MWRFLRCRFFGGLSAVGLEVMVVILFSSCVGPMGPSKKARLTEDEKNRLQSCLSIPGASDRAVRSIWNEAVASSKEKIPHSTFQNYVADNLKPALRCFDRCVLPGKTPDQQVVILIANLEEMMHFVGQYMPDFSDLISLPLLQGQILQPILYHDEAIASNPLAAEKVMKSMLVYLSWRDLRKSLWQEDVWLPVACLQHSFSDCLPAGFNAVMSLLVDQLFSKKWEQGFATNLCLCLHL